MAGKFCLSEKVFEQPVPHADACRHTLLPILVGQILFDIYRQR